jgi:branched-chain amino acid transport system substrate-binding protein
MKKNLIVFSLILVAVLVIVLVVTQMKKEPGEIKIGVISPLTGPAAPYGENVRDGILLAVEEINHLGGISRDKIRLIIEDEGGGPRAAVDAVNKLITVDHVDVIIGPTTSNGLMASAPIAEDNHVVLFSPGAASDNVREAGDYIFRDRASAYQEAVALARYAQTDIGLMRFAILRSDADYAVSFADSFRQTVQKNGGIVVREEAFQEGSTDYRTQLSKIAGAEPKPEGLFIIGVPIELGNILKQIKEMGLKLPLFSNSIESPDIFKIAGDATEGLVFSTTFYDPEHGDERLKEFDEKFVARYGRPSDLFAANGYDAVYIIKSAIEKSRYDGEQIKNALYNLKFRGLMGPIEFDEKGDIRAVIAIKKIDKGKFEFIKVIQ